MKLRLTNGYPYPYPLEATEEENTAFSEAASGNRFIIKGVKHFEWLHTVTVEFNSPAEFTIAKAATGWRRWRRWSYCVLEAPTSAGDGYGHPAIIVGNMAYCGFILENDDAP